MVTFRLVSAMVIAAGAISCSLSRFAYTPCTTNKQCRDSFGWGYVCNEDRLCADVEPIARCAETYPADLLQRKQDYANGVIIGLQFDQTAFEAEMNAAELAVQQVMRQEGLAGRPFGLVKCTNESNSFLDSLTQDDANEMVSEYLADQVGVVAIVGPATSDRVDSAFLAVEPYGTLMMSPTATSPSLTEIDGARSTYDDPGLLWRTAPPDDLQGRVLAEYAISEGLNRIAAVYEEGPYGTALAVVFRAAYEGSGTVVDLLPYTAGSSASLADQVDSAASANVDAVLFISAEKDDVADFLQAAVDSSGFRGKRILMADGARDTSIFEAVDGLTSAFLEQIQGTAPSPAKTQVYENFADEYRSKYPNFDPEQTPYTAYAYDAAWLVIYGAAWAHYNEVSMTGLGVARGLRQLSKPGGVTIDIGPTQWNALWARFREGEQVNVRGASGELDYDPETGETSAPIEVWGVRFGGDGYQFIEIDRFNP